MRERKRIDNPYAKPWVAEDAAKNVVRKAVDQHLSPQEVSLGDADVIEPDYAATVGRITRDFRSQPIGPDEIGVTGFAPEGQIFPLPEVWQQVTGREFPSNEAPVDKSRRSRKQNAGAVPEPAPDAHLESQYEERQSGDPWDE